MSFMDERDPERVDALGRMLVEEALLDQVARETREEERIPGLAYPTWEVLERDAEARQAARSKSRSP